MPLAPLRPCPQAGCSALVRGRGRCEAHKHVEVEAQVQRWREADAARPSSHARGYDTRWVRASKGFLAKHPLCVECTRLGRVGAATLVDHIVPHRSDKTLFWDRSNWQAMCKPHHDAKTRRGE